MVHSSNACKATSTTGNRTLSCFAQEVRKDDGTDAGWESVTPRLQGAVNPEAVAPLAAVGVHTHSAPALPACSAHGPFPFTFLVRPPSLLSPSPPCPFQLPSRSSPLSTCPPPHPLTHNLPHLRLAAHTPQHVACQPSGDTPHQQPVHSMNHHSQSTAGRMGMYGVCTMRHASSFQVQVWLLCHTNPTLVRHCTCPSFTMTQPTAGLGKVWPRPRFARFSASSMKCLSCSVTAQQQGEGRCDARSID